MEEIWKDIAGYEGIYGVSNYGNVKNIKTGRILKPKKDRYGYLQVNLSNKQAKTFKIHRLVYSAFNGPIPEGMQVNHINEDKTDNRLCNLNIMSSKENINWGNCIERRSAKQRHYVIQYSLNGDLIKRWESLGTLYKATGYDCSNISKCCNGKIKSIYGYVWKYER